MSKRSARMLMFGAGASYGASRHGDVRCPLVNEILPTAARLGLLNANYPDQADRQSKKLVRESGGDWEAAARVLNIPLGSHLEVLRSFVQEQLGISEKEFGARSIDFERLFGLIESNLLGHHGLLRLLRVTPDSAQPPDMLEMQFMFVLCGSLIASTRNLRCDYHDLIASWMKPGDIATSFNYDLLLDRSLAAARTWSMDDGYGLKFHRIGRRRADGDVTWHKPSSRESDVLLLKPHGSMNWLYPKNSWESVMHLDLHKKIRKPPEKLFCLEEIFPDFEDDHPLYEWWERYDYEYRNFTYDLHSVIVPPTLAKPYRAFESFIGTVWARLMISLMANVAELYLIGYSLREDDLRSAWLFRKVASESESLSRVVVIDPSDEVFGRARRLFHGRKVIRGPRSLSDFASNLP